MKRSATHCMLVAIALLLNAQAAQADSDTCSKRSTAIVRKAYPKAKPYDNRFTVDGATITLSTEQDAHNVVCRIWPAHPELTLAAIPLITQSRSSGSHSKGDLDLLVLNSASLNVKQRLRLTGRMSDDAIWITQVSFDTARYKLASGQTAFGLRLFKRGSSRPNPFYEVDLWLYVVDGSHIRPVLDGIVVKRSRGEWDTNCAGTFDDTERTIATDRAKHNGYADLLITETTSSTIASIGQDGQCERRPGKTTRSTSRLVYNGAQYDVPEALKPVE